MSKQFLLAIALCFMVVLSFGQGKDKAIFEDYSSSYYYGTILRDLTQWQDKQKPKAKKKRFRLDVTDKNIPDKPTDYVTYWHNKPISQGNTGTCWCFATTSFYESEVKRLTGKEVRLSQMYVVYFEYVERARYFVEHRGDMFFGEGSETNDVARIMAKYGTVPLNDYTGLINQQPFHSHDQMFKELKQYLDHVKQNALWDTNTVINTFKSIMNYHMGVPPSQVVVDGKKYTPKEYLKNYLKINPTDYVEFMSLAESPYNTMALYDVPDNWWRSADYHNVSLDDFMSALDEAVKAGYTVSIGGDVSEPGFELQRQTATVPDFDVPSEYINEYARQMRFNNKSTTDDHAMHLVGRTERNGKIWYLFKDSSAGSRTCGTDSPSFGYYYVAADYVKLKMMTYTVHKDAVKKYLSKFK